MSSAPTSATRDEPGPALAGGLALDSQISCAALHGTLAVRACIRRQLAAARGRTRQRDRGQGTIFPSCDGCRQGAALRKALDPGRRITWRGAGGGWLGRFLASRSRSDALAQERARRRLELVGLLDAPPSLDAPPEEADEAAAV